MTTFKTNLRNKLMLKWVIANFIAWPVGIILAIILSHLIVNIFHPEETNLIVGLCVAFSIGFAQWLILKGLFKTSYVWFVIPSLAIGLPYGWMIFHLEAGKELPLLLNTQGLFMGVIFFICGAFIGFFQSRLKSIKSSRTILWILISAIAWGVSISLQSFLFSGLIIGFITLTPFILLIKEKYVDIQK